VYTLYLKIDRVISCNKLLHVFQSRVKRMGPPSCSCPAGPTGPSGPPGTPGLKGDTGATGAPVRLYEI